MKKEIEQETEFFAKEDKWRDTQNLVSLIIVYHLGCLTLHFNYQMANIQIYKEKLIAIKKDMGNIHSRTRNLKRKATEIQEFKLKQLNQQK